MDSWMIYPGWKTGGTDRSACDLEMYCNHIDHVCQLAGNARHAAIGSDLDGGFGTEETPRDLDTIADLQKIPSILSGKGYSEADIDLIMHGNCLRFFRDAWEAH